MKRRSKYAFHHFCLVFSMLWGFILISYTQSLAQIDPRCQTPQYDALLNARYPLLQQHRTKLNDLILQSQNRSSQGALLRTDATETTIIIPVVIHVIHNTRSGLIGGPNNGNISNEQILSQLDVLNEDYRRKEGTRGFNTHPVGADVNIEFHLATRDPNGNPTSGIIRLYNEQASFDINSDDEKLKALSYWPSNRYLNIWITSLKNKYLGYAQFPDLNNNSQSINQIPGLPTFTGPEKTDGVVINHTNFGRRTGTVVSNVYGDGRTTTHEVAHWLGLLHTWGDDDCGDDFCADTPAASGPNNTITCDELFSTCTGPQMRNMIENFLDYSPDLCMNVFTQNQKERIRKVMELSPRRAELVRRSGEAFYSAVNNTLKIGPNPTKDYASLFIYYTDLTDVKVEVVDIIGRSMKEASYSLTGNRLTLDMRAVPDGLYFIRVSSDQVVNTVKLIVRKDM